MSETPNSSYMTLFSNSPMKTYPNYKIAAAFTVQMAHKIELPVRIIGKWHFANGCR